MGNSAVTQWLIFVAGVGRPSEQPIGRQAVFTSFRRPGVADYALGWLDSAETVRKRPIRNVV